MLKCHSSRFLRSGKWTERKSGRAWAGPSAPTPLGQSTTLSSEEMGIVTASKCGSLSKLSSVFVDYFVKRIDIGLLFLHVNKVFFEQHDKSLRNFAGVPSYGGVLSDFSSFPLNICFGGLLPLLLINRWELFFTKKDENFKLHAIPSNNI